MAVDLTIHPKQKRAAGDACCEPIALPSISPDRAAEISQVARALSDPIRLQIVDVLRRHAGEVCVCELVPLFDVSQPTLSHHLRKLREAGIVGVEKRGLWSYYYVHDASLEPLETWLS